MIPLEARILVIKSELRHTLTKVGVKVVSGPPRRLADRIISDEGGREMG